MMIYKEYLSFSGDTIPYQTTMFSLKRTIVLYSRWEILVEPLKSLPRQGHTLLYQDRGAYKTLL